MGFFKAYDMRGTYGVDFDLETVERVGVALPKVVKGERWLVGRDCRTTSKAVRDALVRGLVASGAKVTDLGLCTTPMVYFFTAEEDFDGSVMVTASHNPPTDNGLKVSKKTALPVGYDNGLARVERLCAASAKLGSSRVGLESLGAGVKGDAKRPYTTLKDPIEPCATLKDPIGRYVKWMKSRLKFDSKLLGLKFAVDCSNGMASLLVKKLFPDAIVINSKLDGTFPAHSPNPLNAAARKEISKLVREKKLDCGIIFDGDADRVMFVDEKGRFVQPDYLIPIVAMSTMQKCKAWPKKGKKRRKIKIIHDVRTSRGAIDVIKALGATPVMVPVGHAFAKPILRREKALCGGELAGHYYFSEFHGCDSGVLAALRILETIAVSKYDGVAFSKLMELISGAWANSGEINFKVEDKDAAIERALKVAEKLAEETSRSTIDGYRLEYDEGWVSIRKSNTEPYLRLIVETDTNERLKEWVKALSDAIEGK